MKIKVSFQPLQRSIAVLLCFLLSPLSAPTFADDNNSSFDEPVGKITVLVSIATRNRTNSNIRDVVRAKDNLSTNTSCRMRIDLLDGLILSVGFESYFDILQY